jgi:CHASE1-domain containing sensor protein
LPQAAERPEYFPVLYSTPVPSSRSVLGVDLGSEAARRDAIERAIDGDRIATAPNIELRHNGDAEWRGFFVAVPVYRRNVPNDTPEQRRANTLGILSGTFQTAGVIESILSASSLPDDVNLYLFAADARPNDLPKFLRSPQARADMGPQTQALPPTNIGPGNSEPATRAGPWSSPPSITALPETWMPFDPRLLG